MKYLISEKISPHRSIDSSGYLICTDAILSRTGLQQYAKAELYQDSTDMTMVDVDRSAEEVFDQKAMASFENKPVTIEHPDESVNPENYSDYTVGFVRDIHKGVDNGKEVMMGTIVITDQDTIEKIQEGKYKFLSCGYDCDFVEENGKIMQKHIRGNHVAICENPRAGITRIQDSMPKTDKKARRLSMKFKDKAVAISAKEYIDKLNVPCKVTDCELTVYAINDAKIDAIKDMMSKRFKFECSTPITDSAYGQKIERNNVTIRKGYHNLSPSSEKFKDVYKIAMTETSIINVRMLINCLEAMYIDAYNDSKEAYQKDIADIAIEKYGNALKLANDFVLKRKTRISEQNVKDIEKYIDDIESLCDEINKNAVPSTFKQELQSMIDKYDDIASVDNEETLKFKKEENEIKEDEAELHEEAETANEESETASEEPSTQEQADNEEEVDEDTTSDSANDSFDEYTVLANSPEEAAKLVKLAIRYGKKKAA